MEGCVWCVCCVCGDFVCFVCVVDVSIWNGCWLTNGVVG